MAKTKSTLEMTPHRDHWLLVIPFTCTIVGVELDGIGAQDVIDDGGKVELRIGAAVWTGLGPATAREGQQVRLDVRADFAITQPTVIVEHVELDHAPTELDAPPSDDEALPSDRTSDTDETT